MDSAQWAVCPLVEVGEVGEEETVLEERILCRTILVSPILASSVLARQRVLVSSALVRQVMSVRRVTFRWTRA